MNTKELLEQVEALEAAGFVTPAAKARAQLTLATKLARAYEHFRYVSEEQITAFRAKLLERTKSDVYAELRAHPNYKSAMADVYRYRGKLTGEAAEKWLIDNGYVKPKYDALMLDPIETYPGIPPTDVLQKVGEARSMGIFDTYEVAHVEPVSTQVKLPDPIVFGRVLGCTDHFFIAEWGDDVKLVDLVGPNGG